MFLCLLRGFLSVIDVQNLILKDIINVASVTDCMSVHVCMSSLNIAASSNLFLKG